MKPKPKAKTISARQPSRVLSLFNWQTFLLLISALFLNLTTPVFAVTNTALNVQMVNGISGDSLPDTYVTAYLYYSDSNMVRAGAGKTNANGEISFDLGGLASGSNYVLQAEPYNGGQVTSALINSAGNFTFRVGTFELTVVDGSGKPMVDQRVFAYEITGSGSLIKYSSKPTDSNGMIRFDLPGLGEGTDYVLKTQGESTYAYSENIIDEGSYTLTVSGDTASIVATGSASTGSGSSTSGSTNTDSSTSTSTGSTSSGSSDTTLTVALVNGITGDSLPATYVQAFQYDSASSQTRVGAGKTNSAGEISFDLPALATGSRFILKAEPYNGGQVESAFITSGGSFTFEVGTLELTLIDGDTNKPVTGQRIHVLDESGNKYTSSLTDSNGMIRFDLPGLGDGTDYRFKTLGDSVFAFTEFVSQKGAYTITLSGNSATITGEGVSAGSDSSGSSTGSGSSSSSGGTDSTDSGSSSSTDTTDNTSVLKTRLVNGITGEALSGNAILAYRYYSASNLVRVNSGRTDSSGYITFDLPGLSSGAQFVLQTEPYNGGLVTSKVLSSGGTFTFKVGTFELSVADSNNKPMSGQRIHAYAVSSSGSQTKYTSKLTDSSGMIRFDLPGLGEGTNYILQTQGDSSWVYSDEISNTGTYTFKIVGNSATGTGTSVDGSSSGTGDSSSGGGTDSGSTTGTGSSTDTSSSSENGSDPTSQTLTVLLKDGYTNKVYSGEPVFVEQLFANGTKSWVVTGNTGSDGKVTFELPGLLTGKKYVLSARPYDTNQLYYSDSVTAGGSFNFIVGPVAVKVTNGSGTAITGKIVRFRRKLDDGTIPFYSSVKTDSSGIAHITLPFDETPIFIAQVDSNYYSDWISGNGLTNFVVQSGTTASFGSLDLTPPTVSIKHPDNNAVVSNHGFNVDGYTADNIAIDSVKLLVNDPVKGQSTVEATVENGYWQATVGSSLITANNTATVTAVAYDTTLNKVSATRSYKVISDTSAASLTVTSHSNNAWILHNGFLLTGTVSDNTGISSLTAKVTDSSYGVLGNAIEIAIDENTGVWTLIGPETSPGGQVSIVLTATDMAGNNSSLTRILKTRDDSINAVQLINRTTFGATPELLDTLAEIGPEAYLQQQLKPASIDNSALNKIVNGMSISTWKDLQDYRFANAVYSKRQLQEVLAEFWDNHFNTDVGKTGLVGSELSTNNEFRANALGYFRDLLDISSKSTTMLLFLDNAYNYGSEPNENFARELMELHTLGVSGGYDEDDVAEVARVFSGWHIRSGAFYFYDKYHDDGEKQIMDLTIPAGLGQEGGERLLDYLATHKSTANFICTKLVNLFVSDSAPSTLVNNCTTAYLNSDGHIGTVVELILRSSAFNDIDNEHIKVKTPLEFMASMNRNYGAKTSYYDTRDNMTIMGMPLGRQPGAEGYKEDGHTWANSNQIVQNLVSANAIAFNSTGNSNKTSLSDMIGFFTDRGYVTAEAIVGYLFKLTMSNDYSDIEWDQAIGILTDDGTQPFLVTNSDAEYRIRRLISTIAGYPGFILQ